MLEDILCASPRRQFLAQGNEISSAVERVLNSESYILGSEVSSFEGEFAKFVGVDHCIGVNSGTDALILSLRAIGITQGDEVIVPSHTAVATVAAVVACNAMPIFVDVDPFSYTIDPKRVSEVVSERTKAIIAVHLYGHPCDMDSLLAIAKHHELMVVEDCAQAHGATWRGQRVGTFGIVGCFSFYPTKNLGAIGDGGAIVTNDPSIAARLFKIRQYGWDAKRNSQVWSGVSRLDEIQAAILRVKLKNLKASNVRRREIAQKYLTCLESLDLTLPSTSPNAVHVFHLFVIQTEQRDKVIRHLNSLQIFPGIHYPTPVHLQPAYKAYLPSNLEGLRVTERLADTILSLPMYPELTETEIQRVCEGIQSV